MISSIELEIITAAVLACLACAVPGTILALGRSPCIAGTVSRTAAPGAAAGIIVSYGFTPWIISVFAFASSMAGLWLIKRLKKTPGVGKGVFYAVSVPFMAAGVFAIEAFQGKGYADINLILTGDLPYVPFDRLIINGADAGPWAVYILTAVLIFNIACVWIFYKEIKASSVDPDYAASVGMTVSKTDFVIFLMTALTTAATIRTAGIFMTAALMLAPAMTASFYAKRLSALILTSAVICAAASLTGFAVAYGAGVSIAGTITAVMGIFFFFTAFLAPESGIIRKLSDGIKERAEIRAKILLSFMKERGPLPADRASAAKYVRALNWRRQTFESALEKLIEKGAAEITEGKAVLTAKGTRAAEICSQSPKTPLGITAK